MNVPRMDEWLAQTKLGERFGYWDAVQAMKGSTLLNSAKGKMVFHHIGKLMDEFLREREEQLT
jgi:hypothetical protein